MPRAQSNSFGTLAWCSVVLGGAAAGVLAGLGAAWSELAEQRYLELGFQRTALALASEHAVRAGIAGAVFGLALMIVLWALARCVLPLRPFLSPAALSSALSDAAARPRGYLTLLGLGTAALACAAVFGGTDFGRGEMLALLAGLAAALLAYGIANVATAGRRTGVGVTALVAFLVAAGVLGAWLRRRGLFSGAALDERWGQLGVLAAVLIAVAALVFAARGASRSARALLALCALPCVAVGLLALAPRGLVADGPSVERPWNVVLIGIDTLRADRTSLYGAGPLGRKTTPNLDELASRGVRFSNAISQAPWTLPAFASIITGRYPHQHGADSLTSELALSEVTLAEILRDAGYATGGAVSNVFLDRKHNFDQGCEWYRDDQTKGHDYATSPAITDAALEFLRENAERSFFLFAHYFDPHYQYLEHPEFGWSSGYQGWWREQLNFGNLIKNRHLLDDADVQWMRDLYDEEIAFTDREIGRLLQGVRELGLEDRTLFIVVADHGEEFLDHDGYGHTTTLYEELVRVPLLVVPPRCERAGEVVARPVETREIFATVLDTLGIDWGTQNRTRSLLAKPQEGEPGGAAPGALAFSTVWLPDANLEWGKRFEQASLRTERYKLIIDRTRGKTMLFDILADPAEQHDLAASDPQVLAELEPLLQTWLGAMLSERTKSVRTTIDPDLAERLKKLGYM